MEITELMDVGMIGLQQCYVQKCAKWDQKTLHFFLVGASNPHQHENPIFYFIFRR